MIYYHADDFGITTKQADIILDCCQNGKCNSISIMPNSPQLLQCHDVINQLSDKNLRYVIHINLIEGHSVADPQKVTLLTNQQGMLNCSFGSLLKSCFYPLAKRRLIYQQLKEEIAAQLEQVISTYHLHKICLDSHQHLHMIPLVYHAMMAVVREKNIPIEAIRIPVDPLSPLLTTPRLLLKMPFINAVKWFILKILSLGKTTKLIHSGIEVPLFFGIFYTCQMTPEVVSTMLPKYKKLADRMNKNLELMFHPGAVYEKEKLLDPNNDQLVHFYCSDYRIKEQNTLMNQG